MRRLSSGHRSRRSDLAVPDTDTKSRQVYVLVPDFLQPEILQGESLSFHLVRRGILAEEAPATPAENRRALQTIILCAGVVRIPPPATQSAALPLSSAYIPSKKSCSSFITSGPTKTITPMQALAHKCIRDCSCARRTPGQIFVTWRKCRNRRMRTVDPGIQGRIHQMWIALTRGGPERPWITWVSRTISMFFVCQSLGACANISCMRCSSTRNSPAAPFHRDRFPPQLLHTGRYRKG